MHEFLIDTFSKTFTGSPDTRELAKFAVPVEQFTLAALQTVTGVSQKSLGLHLNFRPHIGCGQYTIQVYLVTPPTGEDLIEPAEFGRLIHIVGHRLADCSAVASSRAASEKTKEEAAVAIDEDIGQIRYDEETNTLVAPSRNDLHLVETLLAPYSAFDKKNENSSPKHRVPVELRIGDDERPVTLAPAPPLPNSKREPGEIFLVVGALEDLLGSRRTVRIAGDNKFTIQYRTH